LLIPQSIDRAELKRDRALQEDLMTISVKVRALHESLQDTLAALHSDLMTACNDGYAAIKRSGQRDSAVKMAAERIGQRYRKQRTALPKVEA
jgi:tRNA A-37 threonylcarbamoyl transferase component Bud32